MKTFWFILTMAAVIWYTVITAYVSFKGVGDIKEMLGNLAKKGKKKEGEPEPPSTLNDV
jgi:hypothetical protein